jgi:electron-transferring-flavoprotein dehydrogenase
VRAILEGGERIEWGAKTIPGGGFHALPRRFHAPGLLVCGDGVGMVNVPTLKGFHYAIESGRLAAEAAFAAVSSAADDAPVPADALASYDDAIRGSFIWDELHEVRDLRQVFGRGFFLGGALGMVNTISKGRVSIGSMTTEPDDEAPLLDSGHAVPEISHDGQLTFDRLSSVFASGNKTRDDQPNHLRIRERVAPDVAELWANLCPAQVYTVGPVGDDGLVDVEIAASNCVQCGAISAKGGRLTPPEGGSGPEYWQT